MGGCTFGTARSGWLVMRIDDWSMDLRRRKERIVVRWRGLQRLPVSLTKIERIAIGFFRRNYAWLSTAAVTRYPNVGIPLKRPLWPYTITALNFINTFCIDATVKIWSKSDTRLRRYYVIFVATTKNNKNYAQTESDSCHSHSCRCWQVLIKYP